METFHDYETKLGLPITDIPVVKAFEKKYNVRFSLWDMRQKFGELKKEWWSESFKEQDSLKMESITKKFSGDANRIKNFEFPNNHTDDVCEALIKEVQFVKDHMKLILALGNKAMTEKFWKRVFEAI